EAWPVKPPLCVSGALNAAGAEAEAQGIAAADLNADQASSAVEIRGAVTHWVGGDTDAAAANPPGAMTDSIGAEGKAARIRAVAGRSGCGQRRACRRRREHGSRPCHHRSGAQVPKHPATAELLRKRPGPPRWVR